MTTCLNPNNEIEPSVSTAKDEKLSSHVIVAVPEHASKRYKVNLRDIRYYQSWDIKLESEVLKQSCCRRVALIVQASQMGLSPVQINALLNLLANTTA